MKTIINIISIMLFLPMIMVAQTDPDEAAVKKSAEKMVEKEGEMRDVEKKAEMTSEEAMDMDKKLSQDAEMREEAMMDEEMDPQKMMEMWQEMIALGPEHEKLAKDVGEFDYVNTFWMSPGAEPMKSTGKVVVEPLMDGRYFLETHEGSMMGNKFTGMGISGYDKVEGQYFSTWMDNQGTGVMKFTGNYNEKGQLVSEANVINPMTGQAETHRVVVTPGGHEGWTMDYYLVSIEQAADGTAKENNFRMMNIEYTRTK